MAEAEAEGAAESKQDKANVPERTSQPFRDFREHSELLWQMLHVTMRGVSSLIRAPQLLEALANLDRVERETKNGAVVGNGDTEAHARIEVAKKEAKLAQREVASGFPIIHAQFVVALWSAMEALLHRFTVQWIVDRPETLLQEPWSNLKIRLGDYGVPSEDQRAEYLFEVLEQSLGSHLRQGLNRFEAVFAALGLGGSVDERVKRTIFELQQVRNVIAHKRGVADRRFCLACPWLSLEVGRPVTVSHEMAQEYVHAVSEYAAELVFRTAEFFGVDDIRTRSSHSLAADGDRA